MTKSEASAVITAIKILPVDSSRWIDVRQLSERQMADFETLVNSLIEETP